MLGIYEDEAGTWWRKKWKVRGWVDDVVTREDRGKSSWQSKLERWEGNGLYSFWDQKICNENDDCRQPNRSRDSNCCDRISEALYSTCSFYNNSKGTCIELSITFVSLRTQYICSTDEGGCWSQPFPTLPTRAEFSCRRWWPIEEECHHAQATWCSKSIPVIWNVWAWCPDKEWLILEPIIMTSEESAGFLPFRG